MGLRVPQPTLRAPRLPRFVPWPLWLRDRRLWLLLAGTFVTLGMAWMLKSQCIGANWDGFQYRNLCYNDIQPLYHARSMNEDVFPYVGSEGTNPDSGMTPKGFVEYPVLTGLLMYVAALLSESGDEFMLWNSILLSVTALGTTVVLFLASGDKRGVAYWAAAPPLILYAFHNWDLLAVLFGTLGLFFYSRGRFWQSGLFCALGASAKLYPIFFLPMLGLAILARERKLGPDGWKFGLGAVGGLLAVNGPFMLLNFDLWKMTYTFHADRTPNFETTWAVLNHYGQRWKQEWMTETAAKSFVDTFGALGLLALFVALGVLVYRGRIPAIQAAFGAMLAFMLLNKIYSVQYTLWVMPFFVLLHIPIRKFAALIIGDTMAYVAVFTFFLHWEDGRFDEFYNYVAIGVVIRTLALAWLLVGVFRGGGQRRVNDQVAWLDEHLVRAPGPSSTTAVRQIRDEE